MIKTKKINFTYVLFVIFLYFFLLKDYLERLFPVLSYSDELLAALAIPVFVIRTKTRLDKKQHLGYGLFIAIFLISGFIGSIVYRYQPFIKVVFPDMFLCMKFWFAIYVGRYAFKDMPFRRYAPKMFKHIKFITWSYLVLIALNYLRILEFPFAKERYGLPAIKLFYYHPTVMVFNSVLLLAILISIKSYVHGTNKYFFLISLIACTSLRSKAFAAVAIFVFIYYIVFVYRKKLKFVNLILFLPIAFVIAWNQIYYYFFSDIKDGSARFLLLKKAVQVATDHFPTGAGFGTYGSYLSGKYYSPLYYRYGLNQAWGLSEDRWGFVSDSFWPMILGQAGWIGLVFYLIAIIKLFQEIQRIEKRSLALYSSGLVILLYMLIDSTGSSSFVHSLSIPLAFWLGVVLNEAKVRQQRHDDRVAAEEVERLAIEKENQLIKQAEKIEDVDEKLSPISLEQLGEIRFKKKIVKIKPTVFNNENDFKLEKPKEESEE